MREQKLIKKGSVTVEAAIFLPLFVIAVLTVAFSMRWILYEIQVTSLAMDEAHRLAITAYYKEKESTDITTSLLLNARIVSRSNDETSLNGMCYVSAYNTDNESQSYTDIVHLSVSYSRSIPFPSLIQTPSPGETTLIFREFVGRTTVLSTETEDVTEDDSVVWVFPVAGERYHLENCPFIQVYARQTTLSTSVRRKYTPCAHCNPEKLGDGNYVFVFPNQGKSYHQGNCFVVDRYVVAMMKSAAEERGYTPCKTCIGEEKDE